MCKRVSTTKKNGLTCSKFVILGQKHPEGASVKEDSESEENKDNNEESESDELNEDEENEQIIEQKPFKSNQFSSGEMICGSVKIDDSSSNKSTSIKQYISMINADMNNLLKQSKLNVDVIELDSKTL